MKYDAIVVGSGITGGWAAKELTEKGLKVLMLERGRNVEHIKDYVNALKRPWDLPMRGKTPYALRNEYPIVNRDVLTVGNAEFWANEKDNPYTETKPFDWFRGYQVGGRSLTWGRQSYRWSDLDFEANAREGVGIDWPIRYQDLAPWYDHVESFAGISGKREGIAHLPDGQFLPPIPLNCVEEHVAQRVATSYGGRRRLINARVANLTQPHGGRVNCQFRNKCNLGCPFGAYFSTQSATLPAAVATGNLTLRPHSIVTRLVYDRDARKAKGVEVLDAETNQTYEYEARIVFLCASTVNSTWLLMNSATDVWPAGLGSSSGELGHNLMDHHFKIGASGRVDGFDDRIMYGDRPAGFYVPRFVNIGDDKRGYTRGFGYQGRASRAGWQRDIAEVAIGAPLKAALTEPGDWRIGFVGFGEMLPNHSNRMYLDRSRRDRWGLPVAAFDCELGENESEMRRDMAEEAVAMLAAAGAKEIRRTDDGYTVGRGIHEMGTARMGRDPRDSVLNANNQVWDAKNVFVTDGSCMASSACVNPSLTYMALTARAADFATKEMRRGNL